MTEGILDGTSLGIIEGISLGISEGTIDGMSLGDSEGATEGLAVGNGDGAGEGGLVGAAVGAADNVGETVGGGTVGASVSGQASQVTGQRSATVPDSQGSVHHKRRCSSFLGFLVINAQVFSVRVSSGPQVKDPNTVVGSSSQALAR